MTCEIVIVQSFVLIFYSRIDGKIPDFTALIRIVGKHFRHLFQVIAGHTIGDNMNGISCLCHVETGGFHAASGISSGYVKLPDIL